MDPIEMMMDCYSQGLMEEIDEEMFQQLLNIAINNEKYQKHLSGFLVFTPKDKFITVSYMDVLNKYLSLESVKNDDVIDFLHLITSSKSRFKVGDDEIDEIVDELIGNGRNNVLQYVEEYYMELPEKTKQKIEAKKLIDDLCATQIKDEWR